MNLLEGLHKELDRAKELLKLYQEIPGGAFGASMISLRIEQAERSLKGNSIEDMAVAYNALEALE